MPSNQKLVKLQGSRHWVIDPKTLLPSSDAEKFGFDTIKTHENFKFSTSSVTNLINDWCVDSMNENQDIEDKLKSMATVVTGISDENDPKWQDAFDTNEKDFINGCNKGFVDMLKELKFPFLDLPTIR